ncbi:MAG TPA: type II toxin-antitoxin system HicA family toxin [Pirellulales bacterium]|nr:type II toxin-antitoxin system HicA family toxin [Pirellulales bacterium]
MKRHDLIRHLEKYGCELLRQGANHSMYRNPANRRRAPVPRHREIGEALARKICDLLEIPRL